MFDFVELVAIPLYVSRSSMNDKLSRRIFQQRSRHLDFVRAGAACLTLCAVFALSGALASCVKGPRPSAAEPTDGEEERPVVTEEAIGEFRQLRRRAENCWNRNAVSDAELVAASEWVTAAADATAGWRPAHARSLRALFDPLHACVEERGLRDELSDLAAARFSDASGWTYGSSRRPADASDVADAADAAALSAIRRLGDAARCSEFLEQGLLATPLAPSCARLVPTLVSSDQEPTVASAAHRLDEVCGDSDAQAPFRLPDREPSGGRDTEAQAADAVDSVDCSLVGLDNLPADWRSPVAALGAVLYRAIFTTVQRASHVGSGAIRFPEIFRSLRADVENQIRRQTARVPLGDRIFAGRADLRLPNTLMDATGLDAYDDEAIDYVLIFDADRASLVGWPTIQLNLGSGEVAATAAPGLRWDDGVDLRLALARSVSPERTARAELIALREQWDAREGAVLEARSGDRRALVLMHRVGVWAALRPALCAAHDAGVERFQFVGVGTVADAADPVRTTPAPIDIPMTVQIVHPDRDESTARQPEVEARADGFLVTLIDGETAAFPFVEGDAYLRVSRFLREHGVTRVILKAEPRVELQILALLASAIGWERVDASSATSDRALLAAPPSAPVPEIAVSLRTRCGSDR